MLLEPATPRNVSRALSEINAFEWEGVQLAEQRRPPFLSSSVPVKLVYDSEMPQGLAAVCEKSPFLAKNIVIFLLGNEDQLLHTVQAYAMQG
jgi:hypothetical protein